MSKIAIVSTVKAPLEELKMFVNYHLNIGVDDIVLCFDDPADQAIAEFRKNQNVTCVVCTDDYWKEVNGTRPDSIEGRQTVNVNQALVIVIEKGADWVVHIDCDELIRPEGDLKALLDTTNADVIRFEVLEAVSEKTDYPNIFTPEFFKKKPRGIQLRLAKMLGCKRALFNNEYFRGHLASKSAFSLNGRIQKIGIHEVIEHQGDLILEKTSKVKLLHYDCIGLNNWKMKWLRRVDGSGFAANMRGNRSEQFRLFAESLDRGPDQIIKLYNRLHVIPPKEKFILFLLGMLKRIRINPDLFQSPVSS